MLWNVHPSVNGIEGWRDWLPVTAKSSRNIAVQLLSPPDGCLAPTSVPPKNEPYLLQIFQPPSGQIHQGHRALQGAGGRQENWWHPALQVSRASDGNLGSLGFLHAIVLPFNGLWTFVFFFNCFSSFPRLWTAMAVQIQTGECLSQTGTPKEGKEASSQPPLSLHPDSLVYLSSYLNLAQSPLVFRVSWDESPRCILCHTVFFSSLTLLPTNPNPLLNKMPWQISTG